MISSKTTQKALAGLLVLMMLCSLLPGVPVSAASADAYTYKGNMSELGTNWNSHSWTSDNDSAIMSYLETPLASMSIRDSELGVYQWVYDAATYVTDVTAEHQEDLTKYAVSLPGDQTAEQTEGGYVFEIGLNPDMKWENGTPINADTYIYSMKALLDPAMKNYRANLYYSGSSAVAGGEAYYYAGSCAYLEDTTPLSMQIVREDGTYANAAGESLYFALRTGLSWLGGESLETYVNAYGTEYFDVDAYESLAALADENGNVVVNAESLALMTAVISNPNWGEGEGYECNYVVAAREYPKCEYDDTVGCYKVDEYTIRYVTQYAIDINYFLVSCSSNWLVYEDLYEAGKYADGGRIATNYNTSMETTMSYGPYRIESLTEGAQITFVQNENWYGYEKQTDGSLASFTNFNIDGKPQQQYQATRIVIDVMDDDSAKLAFLKGELSEWNPGYDDLMKYASSDRLYKAEETYTQSFFFNTGVENLQAMDDSMGNTNSVVLSNENFRKAFSLSIDRNELVNATSGYKPAYALMNSLYYYDVYNDPTSSYRNSEPAMQAICSLYGVEYGEGTPYATVREAYLSIDGYELTEAKALMAVACQELVDAGLYTAGEDIVIRIAWTMGYLDSAAKQQAALLNKYINAAAEGSGFGTITLEPVGNIENRYAAVPNGEYAIGYGAWGGAAFYPFRNLQIYFDTEQYSVNELGCWDPASESLTLNVNGEDISMTWQNWSRALVGTGPFADASNEVKLQITAAMEEAFLAKYYRIPLMSTTACFMVSKQLDYYTANYNIMYGFGGLRLMQFNYSDAEWEAYLAENELDYENPAPDMDEEKENPFADVEEELFYYEPVMWAVEKGITSGVSEHKFAPDNICTRAQVVTFLWRAAGCPAPKSTEHPFTDIVEGEYYYDAVLWAVEEGITNGINSYTFGTDRSCTRGQVVTFLWRTMKKPPHTSTTHPFRDVVPGEYYYDAVLWAVEKNITNGTSPDTFAPDNTCTRGQVVTFLHRTFVGA